MSMELCDRRMPVKLKVYKTVVRPAMMCGMEATLWVKSKKKKDWCSRDEDA